MDVEDQNINIDDLKLLLDTSVETCYKVTESDPKAEGFVFNSLKLFEKDYTFSIINNDRGELCPHYPSSIVVIEDDKSDQTTSNQSNNSGKVDSIDPVQFTDLLQRARFARYRTHFPVPVIHFEGKRICRSATVAESPENYREDELEQFYHIRDLDLRVLKQYSIGYICDLMVEKVKIKFGIRVASSEKIDKDKRYADFTLCTIPYPGCEYFTEWRKNGYVGRGMHFDWTQKMVDADLELPEGTKPIHSIDWTNYKQWDIISLTQNYLKLFLHYIVQGNCGLLMHCISGWHRTPMFISLLRLSLWADMAIHQSLGPLDILYLTVAYDWFLFGHNFQCLVKGEDIFVFCFDFLNYITSEEFSVSSFKPTNQNDGLDSKIDSTMKKMEHLDTKEDDVKCKACSHKNNVTSTEYDQPRRNSKGLPTKALPEASKCSCEQGCGLWDESMFCVKEESPRKQRLDAVRKIFLNNFRGVNGQPIPMDPERIHQKFTGSMSVKS